MTDYRQELSEVMANNKNLFASTGETGKSFMGVHDAAIKAGTLDSKMKALEALAIAVAIRCEGCIVQHVKGALSSMLRVLLSSAQLEMRLLRQLMLRL